MLCCLPTRRTEEKAKGCEGVKGERLNKSYILESGMVKSQCG